jgi:hypothetical protein
VLCCVQIPANAIAAALQRLEADSDSEDGDGGFTEAGSVWGGDEVRRGAGSGCFGGGWGGRGGGEAWWVWVGIEAGCGAGSMWRGDEVRREGGG